MILESCIPVIPSFDLGRSLRLWVEALDFSVEMEMRDVDGNLTFCMLRKGALSFMLNRRAGTQHKPKNYEGIRLYWAPSDIHEAHRRLRALGYAVSNVQKRDYGQTEFFLTDDDGFSHCFGVPTPKQ